MPAFATRGLRALHHRIAVPLLKFALPTPCFACFQPLDRFQLEGACLACWGRFRALRAPCCPTCALPRPEATDLTGPAGGRCPRCVLDPPALTAVRAAVAYDTHARAFLLRAKVGGRRELLPWLGLQAASIAAGTLAEGCGCVVPVPSHPAMTLRRGFRPAYALARVVARRVGVPLRSRLLRVRWTARLAAKRLSAGRRRLAGDAFVATAQAGARPVLLVDDVMTTGASLDACARVLLDAGAPEVRAAIWARRLPPP